MVQYRRNHEPDGLYFFTVTLKHRYETLLTDHIDLLKNSFQRTQKENPYQTKAIVILPDHIHAVWQLSGEDQNYSQRWCKIKKYFTHELKESGLMTVKNQRNEHNIWQPRFWEHTISNEIDCENHINYIHYNPVKHGLVKHVKDWPHSSFHRYVNQGLLNLSWGSSYKSLLGGYGEWLVKGWGQR